tara:strand:+ start:1040 stop:1255 length:216 start_codon:yes stop_codon:yes gene_type:complete
MSELKLAKYHRDLESVETKITMLKADSRYLTTRILKHTTERKQLNDLIYQLKSLAKSIEERIDGITKQAEG